MKQLRVTGAVILVLVIIAIAAAWTLRETKDKMGNDSDPVNRTRILDQEVFDGTQK